MMRVVSRWNFNFRKRLTRRARRVRSGRSSNWREAAKTLRELAANNGLTMHRTVYFHEPYVDPDGIPAIVEDTYQQTRSQ